MTNLLTITARPDAPVACDMTAAEDSLADRLGEYRQLYADALVDRVATDTSTTFRFTDGPGVRDRVLDLVRREAACCPFLSFRVDLDGDQVVWHVEGVGASDLGVLDDVVADTSSTSEELARRLTEQGGLPVILPTAR
jgi:hypothetical protein